MGPIHLVSSSSSFAAGFMRGMELCLQPGEPRAGLKPLCVMWTGNASPFIHRKLRHNLKLLYRHNPALSHLVLIQEKCPHAAQVRSRLGCVREPAGRDVPFPGVCRGRAAPAPRPGERLTSPFTGHFPLNLFRQIFC